MIVLYAILAALFVLWALFVLFIAVMALRDARDNGLLTGPIKFFGYPTLFIGLFVDAFANCIFPVWLIFADWPYRKGEALVTSRLQRYYKQDSKRGRLSCWFCDKILHIFDKKHCE